MLKLSQSGRAQRQVLVENSPLRPADPRTKLALSLCASLAVMLPLERLLVFVGVYVLFMAWARLLSSALVQVWRMRWIIVVLFVLDAWLVDLDLAVIITLRLALLAGVFTLFFATTTASELGLALEKLRIPYRYAFSLSLAFQSLGLLDDEWRTILEAQQARGITFQETGWRKFLHSVRELVALTVPAIVMTTRRAWSITEAAYARGFDSPRRVSYRELHFSWMDYCLLSGALVVALLLLWL